MGGMIIGSYAGSFIPALWSNSALLSPASILWSIVGGFVGIYAGFKIGQRFD